MHAVSPSAPMASSWSQGLRTVPFAYVALLTPRTAAATDDPQIWNTQTNDYVTSLVGHRGEVYALAFTKDARYLLSASGDRTIRVWDASQFQSESAVEPTRVLRSVAPQEKPSSKMVFTSLSVDSLSSFAVAGSLDGLIRVWDIRPESESELPVGVLSGHADGVYGVQFLPNYAADGPMTLVSASLDRTLKRWEITPEDKQFSCNKSLSGHKVLFPFYVEVPSLMTVAGLRVGNVCSPNRSRATCCIGIPRWNSPVVGFEDRNAFLYDPRPHGHR